MKEKIIPNQLMILMFLISLTFMSSLSSNALSDNIWDTLVSVFIVFVLNVICAIPIIKLSKKTSLIEKIFESKLRFILIFLYVIYFIFSEIISLSQLENLFLNTIFPDITPWVLIGLLLVASIYGAFKGIETVARSSYFALVFMLVGVSLVILGVFYLVDLSKREIFFYNGINDTIRNSIIIFSRSNLLPQFAILLFTVKNNFLFRKFLLLQILIAVFCSISFLIIVLSMGRFAQTQIYPFYTLFTISKLKPLQRLDSVFSIIWLMLYTLKVSVSLLCIKNLFSKDTMVKYSKIAVLISSVIILVSSVFFVGNYIQILSILQLYTIIPAIVLGTIIPIYFLLKGENS